MGAAREVALRSQFPARVEGGQKGSHRYLRHAAAEETFDS